EGVYTLKIWGKDPFNDRISPLSVSALMEKFSIDENTAKRALTEGGKIEGLSFVAAKKCQLELDTCEAQYVKTTIVLTDGVNPIDVIGTINRGSEGMTYCNVEWGQEFIENPFGVAHRILTSTNVRVEFNKWHTPHAYWKASSSDGQAIIAWNNANGSDLVELTIDQINYGVAHIRHDGELAFLIRKAVEALVG